MSRVAIRANTFRDFRARPDQSIGFRGSRGVVHIVVTSALSEEFDDRSPVVSVPATSALRPLFEHAVGMTAVTHRNSLDLTLGAPQ